jgi:hypothetical protein
LTQPERFAAAQMFSRFDTLESTQMTPRVMIGILSILGMWTCGLIASFKTFEMVDKVNERLPKQERFDPLWWHPSKRQRLVREYKRLYPAGHLLTHSRIVMFVALVCLLISAWGFRFFAR